MSCSLKINRFVWLSSTTSTRNPTSPSAEANATTGPGSTSANANGNVNQNVLPRPSSLSTPSSPPIAVTN